MIRYAGIGDEAGPGLDTQIAALHRLGWDAIELRSVDGTHLADLSDRRFAAVTTGIADAGLDVVCVDSRIGNWARPISGRFQTDLAELDVLAERCAILGTRAVRIMSYPNAGLPEDEWGRRVLDRLHVLVDRAEQSNLVLLHENCVGWAATSGTRMVDMLTAVDSPALRLLFDIGNGVEHGYRAVEVLREVVEHVAHVHVKDAVKHGPQTLYTMPGHGEADISECLRILLAHGYHGALSIEPHLTLRPHDGIANDDKGASFVAFGSALQDLVEHLDRPQCTLS